jgi:hypothetical protein
MRRRESGAGDEGRHKVGPFNVVGRHEVGPFNVVGRHKVGPFMVGPFNAGHGGQIRMNGSIFANLLGPIPETF